VAFTVPAEWSPSDTGTEATTAALPAPGSWLVAIVAVRVVNEDDPVVHVGDAARNIWTLPSSKTAMASAYHAAAKMKVQVWVCPAAEYDGWDALLVQCVAMCKAGSTADATTILAGVFEVTGFAGNNLTVDSVTLNTATSATAFSVSSPAPAGAANCFHLGAACIDDDTTTLTPTGAGFAALTAASGTVPDIKAGGQWKAATTGQTASWTSSAARNWAGVIVAIKETGDTVPQPNAKWPARRFEIGYGYDMNTPLSAVRWTDQTTRLVTAGSGVPVISGTRGIPYELGTAQSELSDLKIRNDDGALTPRDVNAAASANAAGTTTTIKFADADAADINVSDFFRLKDSALAYKELTVFQVSAVSSSAGTTTVTFARADDVAGGAASSTVSGDVYAGIEIDLDMPWRYLLWWDGKWWPAGSGWLGQLPQTWLTPNYGEVPAVGNDALASLTAELQSPLAGEILRREPAAYWPLSDPAGSGQGLDVSGNGQPPLVQTTSKFGAGSATASFGYGTQDVAFQTNPKWVSSILGDTGSAWSQTGHTEADLDASKGYALVAQGLDVPPISSGITVTGAYLMQDEASPQAIPNSNFDPTLFIVKSSDPGFGVGQGAVLKLSFENTGADFLEPKITVWDKDTHANTVTVITPFQIASPTDFRVWVLSFDRTSWRFYANGQWTSGSCDLVASFDQIDVGGEADKFHNGKAAPGAFCHIAIFGRAFTDEEMEAIRAAFLDGEVEIKTTAQHAANKLNVAGWHGPRIILPSEVDASSEGNPGGTVADYNEGLAAMDDGLAYVDAAGQYRWEGHSQGYFRTSRATLGEDTAAGEIPYQPGQKWGFDKTFVYNDVQLVNQRNISFSTTGHSGLLETRYAAQDAESQRKRGKRTLPVTARLRDGNDAYGLAWALQGRYAAPRMRVEQVVIDAASNPDAWRFCLGVEVGDLVTVKRRPLGAPAISQLCRVLRIELAHGPSAGRWTLSLIPVDQVITLGDGLPLGEGTIGW
jgi:hypothetical protein